jgi:molybdopterin molybdotransferase
MDANSPSLPQLDPVPAAIARLTDCLRSVGTERLSIGEVAGRVLAERLLLDRDSPPLDTSAMDGYALALADVAAMAREEGLPVRGVAAAGAPPVTLASGEAVRIFTGAPVPAGADCVVQREHTQEQPQRVRLTVPVEGVRAGMNIRRQGENAAAGSLLLDAGTLLTGSAMAAVASAGPAELSVRRRVRVGILNTGDELVEPGQPASAWQIRDSNGPTLEAALSTLSWVEVVFRRRVPDDLTAIRAALEEATGAVDALWLTGGVSMGDTDHVPAAVADAGGRVVFHRLPIRPGKPILGATSAAGGLILGLPGNPVSVAVTARRIGLPLLRCLAGFQAIDPPVPKLLVEHADDKQLSLVWHRLVAVGSAGGVRLVDSRGSGDLVSLAHSDGFVEVPMGASGPGPWPFYAW